MFQIVQEKFAFNSDPYFRKEKLIIQGHLQVGGKGRLQGTA